MAGKGVVREVTATKAVLMVYPDEACRHCLMCDAARDMEIPIESLPEGIKEGDEVDVSATLAPSLLIGLVYGLPLLFLLAGYLLGIFLFPRGGESGGIGGAAVLFTVSLAVVRTVGRRLHRREKIIITSCRKEKGKS
jgi:positive regulator of sigma E activity